MKTELIQFAGVTAIFFLLLYYCKKLNFDFLKKKPVPKIPVLITVVDGDENLLEFTLESETCNHLELGRELVLIKELTHPESNDLPLLMALKGRYSFSLRKKKLIDWKEVIPKIKKVFMDYFGPVEFSGDFPEVKQKKQRVKVLL